MDKTRFLTIFPSFENLDVVKKTLPTIVEETQRQDARLIVHDSSVGGREEKWAYLSELADEAGFFLLLSTNLSMGHARNMCLALGQELFAPDYICMVEDDHGYEEGLIPAMVEAMQQHYGEVAPNGLRYGLFTGCRKHNDRALEELPDGNAYPTAEARIGRVGGANSCFRCAPTAHWSNVLKGYDTDEYLISQFQTHNLNRRNYHKGFTKMVVGGGRYVFDIEARGRGWSDDTGLQLWDDDYTASDPRSSFRGKPE